MSDSNSDYSTAPQPSDQELRNVKIHPGRARAINMVTFAMLSADVIILAIAAWFFTDGNEVIAYAMVAIVVINIVFVFWFRRMQTKQAKLQAWSEQQEGYYGKSQ